MAKTDYDSLIASLETCGNNCTCSEVAAKLEAADFDVRVAGGPGHRVFSHSKIKGFAGGNYNCGHGKNPKVSERYIKNVLKTLRLIESELREYLGEEDD